MKPTSPIMIFKSPFFSSDVFSHLSPSLVKFLTANFLWNKIYKTPTFTWITPYVTIFTMLEAITTSQDGMSDEFSWNNVAELRKRGIFGGFSEERMNLSFEVI